MEAKIQIMGLPCQWVSVVVRELGADGVKVTWCQSTDFGLSESDISESDIVMKEEKGDDGDST